MASGGLTYDAVGATEPAAAEWPAEVERFDARPGGSYRMVLSGGTRVDLRAEDVPAGISAEDHAAGMASSLDNLAEHVTGG